MSVRLVLSVLWVLSAFACALEGPITVVDSDDSDDGEASGWVALGVSTPDGPVHALVRWNDRVVVAGRFQTAGGVSASNVATFDGESFEPLGTGVDGPVLAATTFAGDLVVGGAFSTAGGASARNVARWDGTVWSALGAGLDSTVTAVETFLGKLHATGYFTASDSVAVRRLARFGGDAWEPVTSQGIDAPGFVFARYDGLLILGGAFHTAGPSIANGLFCWEGQRVCNPGGEFRANESVLALLEVGTQLVVGGRFTQVGSRNAARLARWTGSGWAPYGAGLDGSVKALASHRGALVAGGAFTASGLGMLGRVAFWRSGRWEALAAGVDGDVDALLSVGDRLYVGGHFTRAGGVLAGHLAVWEE